MNLTDSGIRRAMRPRHADLQALPGQLPRHLYHVTPLSNVEAILAEGLRPTTRNLTEEHPPRIYLTCGPVGALTLCRQIRSAMVSAGLAKRSWKEDFAILAVPVEMTDAEFRWDGSSPRESGVYTDQPIQPEILRHIETMDGEALLTANWPRVWNWLIWQQGSRPECLAKLGRTTGLPHFEGWRLGHGTRDLADLRELWDEPSLRAGP